MTDQEFLDRCAISAMNAIIIGNLTVNNYLSESVLSKEAYEYAKAMSFERKSNMVEHKDDFSPYREDNNL